MNLKIEYIIQFSLIKRLSFDLYKEILIKTLNSFQQIREKNEEEEK